MKKVTIIALHLNYGGVEKAICELANSLADYFDVEIICTYKFSNTPAFNIDNKVNIKYLMKDVPNKEIFLKNLKKHNYIKAFKEGIKGLKILYLRKKLLIKELKKSVSNIIISTRSFHNRLVGKYVHPGILTIAWEHNYHQNNQKYIKKTIRSIKKLDYFVLVSKELKDFYQDKVKPKCIYIPNSITISNTKHKLERKLIAIGRLEPEKDFLNLIEIYNEFNNEVNDYKLIIIGDGSQMSNLKNKIKEYNLENKVVLKGFLSAEELHKELETAYLYLMTSLTESFGIVLIEAMSHGIPCIAFDSATGAKEIIKDGKNGYLIKKQNHKQYIEHIIELINKKDKYKKFSEEALKTSKKFESSEISQKWLNLLESPKSICYNNKKDDAN